jgi:hypothetical protein
MSWLQNQILQLLLLAVPIGLIASIAFQFLKRASLKVDSLPPWLKNGAVYIIAMIVTTVTTVLGVPIVCEEGANCLSKIDQNTLKMLIEAALSLGVAKLAHLKLLQKKKK